MNYQYKFSVIMAIYNTGEYLYQSIDSIINQTMNFEDNVQLILVDDESTDNSRDIIREYEEKFPENIKGIFLKENKGQSNARNRGLKYVKGKYVNFLDSDDYLSDNTLEEVYSFFEEHYHETDIVAIPIYFFERMNGEHILNKKFRRNRVIDLIEEPNNPQLSSSSAFFKGESLKRYEFPTNVSFSEDSILINKLLFEKKTLGVINTARYYYRKRADSSSTIDTSTLKEDYFIDRLKNYFIYLIDYSMAKENEVPSFIQYMFAYEIQWTLRQPELSLDNQDDKKEFWKLLDYILDHMDFECISHNQYITYDLCKLYFIYLKKKNLHYDFEDKQLKIKSDDYVLDNLNKHKLWIDIIKIDNDILKISGFLNSLFDIDHVSIVATRKDNNKGKEDFIGKYVKYTSRKDVVFLSRKWQFKHNFDLEIPLEKDSDFTDVLLKLIFHKDGNKSNFNENNVIPIDLAIDFSKTSNLSNISNYFIKDSKIVLFQSNMFKIYPYKYKSLIRRELEVLKKLIKQKHYRYKEAFGLRSIYLLTYPFVRRLKKDKSICIFMDRPESGDDNAAHLFKYANTIDDQMIKYYALKDDGKCFDELSQSGKVLKYKSFKHKLMYLYADKIISSHPYQTVINPFFEYDKITNMFYNGLITSKIYFLQHGVTLGNISGWLSKFDKDLSLITTVSQEEHDSYLVEGYNYDEDIIQILGFPRYDNLKNNPKKQILIIPTWRKYLKGNKNFFLNSEYYANLEKLLNNTELIELSKKYGYKIVFKAHPELYRYITDDERYLDLLNINEDIYVSEDESYQQLFEESSIMITDYSSVFFDFAYLKKALIYYQPEDDYHYEDSYFDFESMGFGDVIHEENCLIEKVEYYINNNCKSEEKYRKRVNRFFKYTDKNNCKRVYDWIKND
ncbi:MAG: hypothetical protein BZ137_09240 [Methanosphaera sp. rholeuAM130]|nr:MAG: hypothetical protein BZ137_09240 [Methanosphaera sp. rholeuAM130]